MTTVVVCWHCRRVEWREQILNYPAQCSHCKQTATVYQTLDECCIREVRSRAKDILQGIIENIEQWQRDGRIPYVSGNEACVLDGYGIEVAGIIKTHLMVRRSEIRTVQCEPEGTENVQAKGGE